MGIEAITNRDDGSAIDIPHSYKDWEAWVSAGRTRNWMMQDPLLDWLQLHGESQDYLPKEGMEGYNEDLDFIRFIFERGNEFEAGILRLFQRDHEVVTIANHYEEIRSLEKASETFEALNAGVPIVYQGVLWDAQNLTYGSPDFLVRSDILSSLFPDSVSEEEASFPARDLGVGDLHYLVVDTKFTTLHLNSRGTELANGSSAPAYKAQLYIYNRMLGRLQGYEPPWSFLLGRGWELRRGKETYRGSNAMELLGPIPQAGTVANGVLIADAVEDALRWVRRVRREGGDWQILPDPSVPELYPNMGNVDDAGMMFDVAASELEPGAESENFGARWIAVKKWLAAELKELTQLWQVGVAKRNAAHASGIFRWNQPGVSPDSLGVTGDKLAPTLADMLTVNTADGPLVLPTRIVKTRDEWHASSALEFYVDFEFCSDLNDDFSQLPDKGGQPLIFMVGCGHMENAEWCFRSFVVHCLDEEEELRVIREWLEHMSEVRDRLDPANTTPRLIHWSNAEVTALENAYNSARARHGDSADWPDLGWYDFLTRVMREEPVVIRGALGFGLKAVANAMHAQGLIETSWDDSPVDGLGAMVGAWRCDRAARNQGISMSELPLMKEITRYNEIDCKVMMEIVSYLRNTH